MSLELQEELNCSKSVGFFGFLGFFIKLGSGQGSNASKTRDGKKVMKINHVIWPYHFLGSLYTVSAFKDKYFLLQKMYINKKLLSFSSS